MSSYPDRKASAGLVGGFLAMTALLLFLAALTLALAPTQGS